MRVGLGGLSRRHGNRGQSKAKRLEYALHGPQRWVAFSAKRSIKRLTIEAGLVGDASHTF